MDSNLRSVTNQALFIYHYPKPRGLASRYNYTSQDSDLGQPRFRNAKHFGKGPPWILGRFHWALSLLCPCVYLSEPVRETEMLRSFLKNSSFIIRRLAHAFPTFFCLGKEAVRHLTTITQREVIGFKKKRKKKKLLSEEAIHFVPAAECDLMDTIHLQRRPPGALVADICNWCQGPINHPVSKRPCNAFYISTYVESKRVCHRGKPLSRRKKLFWKPFPA